MHEKTMYFNTDYTFLIVFPWLKPVNKTELGKWNLLYCTISYFNTLYCTALYYVLYYSILHYTLHYTKIYQEITQ